MQDQLLDALRRVRASRQPVPDNLMSQIVQAIEERAALRGELEAVQKEVRDRLGGQPDEPVTNVLDRHIRTHLQLDHMVTVLRNSKNQLIEAAIRFGTDLDALSAELESGVKASEADDSQGKG